MRLVHKGRWALKPRRHHLLLRLAICDRDDIVGVAFQSLRYFDWNLRAIHSTFFAGLWCISPCASTS